MPSKLETDSLFQQRPFAFFWFARVSATVAFQIQAVAIGWQMYKLTGSAFYLGLVGLAQFLPMFVLTLAVGHVADRYDRRAIVRVCQLVEGLATGLLAAASLTGRLDKESILVIVAVIGAARAFEGPSMQSLMPGLVSSALFPRAAAWSASAMQVATIVGPALGGFLYALSPTSVFAVAAVLFLGSSVLISLIKIEKIPPKRERATLQSLFAGISFIRGRQIILGAISLDLFAVLLGGATALLPIYAKDILSTGSWGLGLLRAAPALGALSMSLFLARRPLRRRVGRTMFCAVAVFGLATILFAVSRSFLLSLGALIVLGASDVISVVVRSSLVQLRTPDEMRGRVSAVNSMFIGTSNQLGEFESGLTASWFGTVPAVLIGGLGTLAVVALWVRLFPELARADTLGQE
ncbi:MAG: MFS transporter [Rectinemataceae bacterium]|jgi:MFS family permease